MREYLIRVEKVTDENILDFHYSKFKDYMYSVKSDSKKPKKKKAEDENAAGQTPNKKMEDQNAGEDISDDANVLEKSLEETETASLEETETAMQDVNGKVNLTISPEEIEFESETEGDLDDVDNACDSDLLEDAESISEEEL